MNPLQYVKVWVKLKIKNQTSHFFRYIQIISMGYKKLLRPRIRETITSMWNKTSFIKKNTKFN